MPDEQQSESDGMTPYRRSFLTAVAGTGTAIGIGGMAFAQGGFDTIRFGGEVQAWRGRAPAFIDGETNPELPLQAGQQYTVVWVNLDGEPHNFAILDGTGSAVVRSDIIRGQGETQRVEFTAEPGMTTYLCQVHPTTMRGDVTIEGAGAAGMNVTNVTNATNVTAPTNETVAALEEFRTVELEAFGEATVRFIAPLSTAEAAGLPADGNVTAANETAAANETVDEAADGEEPTGNETAENGTGPTERNETAIEEQRDPGANETVENETDVDGMPAGNETVRNETAIEEQRDPGANETMVGNETAGNETTVDEPVGDETMAGNETQLTGQPETNAARFTLQPPDGETSRLLYNIALWEILDVTGVEIFVSEPGGENVVVASLLAPEDPIDFPQGIVAYGEITAPDLLGPLAGESLVALVDRVRAGDAYVVVQTRDRPGGALFGRIETVEDPLGRTPENGTNTTGGNQTNG